MGFAISCAVAAEAGFAGAWATACFVSYFKILMESSDALIASCFSGAVTNPFATNTSFCVEYAAVSVLTKVEFAVAIAGRVSPFAKWSIVIWSAPLERTIQLVGSWISAQVLSGRSIDRTPSSETNVFFAASASVCVASSANTGRTGLIVNIIAAARLPIKILDAFILLFSLSYFLYFMFVNVFYLQ